MQLKLMLTEALTLLHKRNK